MLLHVTEGLSRAAKASRTRERPNLAAVIPEAVHETYFHGIAGEPSVRRHGLESPNTRREREEEIAGH